MPAQTGGRGPWLEWVSMWQEGFCSRQPPGELPSATALYRIAQEALLNAAKHAPGAPDTLELSSTDEELRLVIFGCSPAGLALGPLQRTMTSCGAAIDARDGTNLASVTLSAGDEIWFNPGDNRYYFGNANVGVIDAETNAFLGYTVGATRWQ